MYITIPLNTGIDWNYICCSSGYWLYLEIELVHSWRISWRWRWWELWYTFQGRGGVNLKAYYKRTPAILADGHPAKIMIYWEKAIIKINRQSMNCQEVQLHNGNCSEWTHPGNRISFDWLSSNCRNITTTDSYFATSADVAGSSIFRGRSSWELLHSFVN